jgi:hypothetical protein
MQNFVRIYDRKRQIGRPRQRCYGITETDLTDIGCDDMDWIHLAWEGDQHL